MYHGGGHQKPLAMWWTWPSLGISQGWVGWPSLSAVDSGQHTVHVWLIHWELNCYFPKNKLCGQAWWQARNRKHLQDWVGNRVAKKKKSISYLCVIVIVIVLWAPFSTGYRPFQQALRGSLGTKASRMFTHLSWEGGGREEERQRDRQSSGNDEKALYPTWHIPLMPEHRKERTKTQGNSSKVDISKWGLC